MPSRVIHFEIQADDVARATAFYEQTFGWQVQQMMSKDKGGMDYWGLTTGPAGTPGINGGMYQRPKEGQLHTFDCTIMVDDIDKAIADVQQNGGTITRKKDMIPGVGWFASAKDTEGNKLGLMQATDWKPA